MQRMTYWYTGSKASHTHFVFNHAQLAYCQACHLSSSHYNNTHHSSTHHAHGSQTAQQTRSRLTGVSLANKAASIRFPKRAFNLQASKQLVTDKITAKIEAYRNSSVAEKKLSKIKMMASVSGVALISLPAIGITTSLFSTAKSEAYSTVMATQSLTVASVAGDSTYFSVDGFQHGFGYDIARAYANNLGVNLVVKTYTNEAEALKAITKGNADMALTTASTQLIEHNDVAAINVSCGYDSSLIENGLNPKTSWSFRSNKDPLAIKASQFLCHNDQVFNTAKLANFYDQTLLSNDYNRNHFEKVLTTALPLYESSFQQQAKAYDHDWQLLVAMGYQESQLNADAVSPTGVRGLMMLTNDTAAAMGVSNRVDPYQSIVGGARYLEQLKQSFSNIPDPDRTWFALASYNMGPNAIRHIQRKLSQAGQDPNIWANVYTYMLDHAASNSRYVQCMHYVTNIRSYLESLKSRSA